jgi:hypothetical protein
MGVKREVNSPVSAKLRHPLPVLVAKRQKWDIVISVKAPKVRSGGHCSHCGPRVAASGSIPGAPLPSLSLACSSFRQSPISLAPSFGPCLVYADPCLYRNHPSLLLVAHSFRKTSLCGPRKTVQLSSFAPFAFDGVPFVTIPRMHLSFFSLDRTGSIACQPSWPLRLVVMSPRCDGC